MNSLCAINLDEAVKIVEKGLLKKQLDLLGTSERPEFFKFTDNSEYVIIFTDNDSYGYAGVSVLKKGESELEFDMFIQNSQDFPEQWGTWSSTEKVNYLLQWWQ